MNKDKILIIGASGTVGSEVVKLLRNNGHDVLESTSRSVTKEHQIQLDLVTGEGVKKAFDLSDRVFLISPPGYADQYAILSPLIQEAKRQGLKKVVLMTAMGANADESSPFRRAELELENSGLQYNIVRPNWFLQNFNTFWLKEINEQRKILLPTGDAKVSFIDARDISEVVAKLIVDDNYSNKAFDLTGKEALDHQQVAKVISSEINEDIIYEDIDPSLLREMLLNAHLPKDYVDFLLTILGFLKEGYNERVTQEVKNILGREPRDISDYVKDYKEVWNAN